MNKKVERLFEEIYECCPELEIRSFSIHGEVYKRFEKNDIHLEHLLRTAEKKGFRITIDSKGQLFILIETCWTFVCQLDLSQSLSNQSEEVLEKIAEVVCAH